MIIAAGSVMNDPRIGAIVKTASHQASGVRPPSAAARAITLSANSSPGGVGAIHPRRPPATGERDGSEQGDHPDPEDGLDFAQEMKQLGLELERVARRRF